MKKGRPIFKFSVLTRSSQLLVVVIKSLEFMSEQILDVLVDKESLTLNKVKVAHTINPPWLNGKNYVSIDLWILEYL
jgi:hypothetical protein